MPTAGDNIALNYGSADRERKTFILAVKQTILWMTYENCRTVTRKPSVEDWTEMNYPKVQIFNIYDKELRRW